MRMSLSDRRGRRRTLVTTGAALLTACTLAACGGGGSSTAGSPAPDTTGPGGTPVESRPIDAMTVSVPQLGDVLHTTRAVGPILGVLLQGLEPLVVYEPDGSLKPNLATSYDQPKPKRYTFELRDDVTFWDGSPLTAEDVVASFRVHMGDDTESASASYWTGVESVRADGDRRIVVDLSAPDPAFIYTVARTGIFSAAFAEEKGKQLGSPSALNMGTGPYRFASFKPFSRVELVRNDDYWGDKPAIARIDAQVLNQNNLLLGLQSGEIDAAFGLPVSQLKSFANLPEFALTDVPDAAVYKFNFDVDKAPWDDIHLRRAFAYAIDHETIARDVLNGADPATALVPSFMFGNVLPADRLDPAYDELSTLVPSYDLERAKDELAQSSTPDGVETTILVMASDPNLSAIAQTVAQSAAEVGIDLEVREVDEGTYNNAVYLKHTTDGVSIDNFGAGSPDYLNIPDLTLNSANIPPTGFTDVADYRNDDVDRMLGEASRLKADDAERGELALDVLKAAGADLPYAPVAFPKVYLGLKDDYSYTGFNAFWWMNRWPDLIAAKGS